MKKEIDYFSVNNGYFSVNFLKQSGKQKIKRVVLNMGQI